MRWVPSSTVSARMTVSSSPVMVRTFRTCRGAAAIREAGGGPAEPIAQVDQLGHPGRGQQPPVVPEQAGSARGSAAAL